MPLLLRRCFAQALSYLMQVLVSRDDYDMSFSWIYSNAHAEFFEHCKFIRCKQVTCQNVPSVLTFDPTMLILHGSEGYVSWTMFWVCFCEYWVKSTTTLAQSFHATIRVNGRHCCKTLNAVICQVDVCASPFNNGADESTSISWIQDVAEEGSQKILGIEDVSSSYVMRFIVVVKFTF